MIWGSFGILVVARRWKIEVLPALFMIYSVDELLWTGTYVLTTCAKDTRGLPWLQFNWDGVNGPLGYYVMIMILGATTLYLLRPRIRLTWWNLGPFAAFFLVYVFVLHMPIMGNECLPVRIPTNLPWEIGWQLAWLAFAFTAFYPSRSVSPGKVTPAYADEDELAART